MEIFSNELVDKVSGRDKMLDHKHAVNPSLGARSAPSMARTVYSSNILSLLINSEYFVSSLSNPSSFALQLYWPDLR